jgi:uncharacterized repeat protein (TIGR01451 family)
MRTNHAEPGAVKVASWRRHAVLMAVIALASLGLIAAPRGHTALAQTAPPPDLAVTQLMVSVTSPDGSAAGSVTAVGGPTVPHIAAYSGGTLSMQSRVANVGGSNACPYWTDRMWESPSQLVYGGAVPPGSAALFGLVPGCLAAGGGYDGSGRYVIPANQPTGTIYIRYITDVSSQDVGETNKTNNVACVAVDVTFVAPDLAVTALTVTSPEGTLTAVGGPAIPQLAAFSGDTLTISSTVTNIAPIAAASPYWTDNMWESTSPLVYGGAVPAGSAHLFSIVPGVLGPGGSYGGSGRYTIPANQPTGTIYICYVTDVSSQDVGESNKSNNVACAEIDVNLIQPELTVTSFSITNPTSTPPSPPSATEGQTASFQALIKNQGTQDAGGHQDEAVLTPAAGVGDAKDTVVWCSGCAPENSWSPGIAVGDTSTMQRSFTVPDRWSDPAHTPISEGTYNLCYVTNFTAYVMESDATTSGGVTTDVNNQQCTPFHVVPSGGGGPTGLHFTKTAATQAFVGDPITYTITVTNYGPGATSNVTVSDPLPAGLFLVSATASAGSCTASGPSVTTASCNLGTLAQAPADGSAATVQITAAATTPVLTTYTNTATVTGDGGASGTPDNGQGSATTTVVYGNATLQPTKTAKALGGGRLEFDVTVLNTGDTATNVIAKDTLQPGLQWVSGTCDGQPMPPPQTNQLSCNLGTLSHGQAKVMTIIAQVRTPGPIRNVAAAHWDGAPADVSSNAVSSPSATPTIVKSHASDFSDGSNGVYTITVTNPSGTAPVLAPLAVSDTLPAGLRFVSGLGGGFTCSAVDQSVTCTSSTDLAPGASAAITLTVAASNTTGTTQTITNTATVAWAGGVSAPAQDPTTILAPPRLAVVKTASADTLTLNHTLTYTITVTNAGGVTARTVKVVDPLPTGVTLVSTSPANACTGTTTLTCSVGDVAAGATATVTIAVKATQTGAIANVATAAGDNAPQAASAPAHTTVLPPPDVAVTKTVAPAEPAVLVGQNLTYTIQAKNLGPSTATNVQVIDPLPAGIILVSVTPDPGMTCNTPSPLPDANPPQLICTVATLANGASAQAVIVVKTVTLGPLANTATVSSDDPDPHPGNNTSTPPATIVFAYPAQGQFVLGDQTVAAAGPATTVNFWGSQWWKHNSLSAEADGDGPAAFKGYDDDSAVPACGQSWTADPGNSSRPPAAIPAYLAVIVSSHVEKSGSQISGDIKQVVIVKTDAGYAGNPGHDGTGVIVAVLCGG